MSIICEAFSCTPYVAMGLDPVLTFGVLEARAALQARAQHNADVSKMTPGQLDLWRELCEAAEED